MDLELLPRLLIAFDISIQLRVKFELRRLLVVQLPSSILPNSGHLVHTLFAVHFHCIFVHFVHCYVLLSDRFVPCLQAKRLFVTHWQLGLALVHFGTVSFQGGGYHCAYMNCLCRFWRQNWALQRLTGLIKSEAVGLPWNGRVSVTNVVLIDRQFIACLVLTLLDKS